MTQREVETRLRRETIALPDGFEARQETILRRITREKGQRNAVSWRLCILAAALMLLTAAAAWAANGRGLAFFWRRAAPEAERLVEKGVSQSGGQLEAAAFAVREAVYDGSTLQAVIEIRTAKNRHAVMLGHDGNVSADAVLVDIGDEGNIQWAEDEDGALLVYISQTIVQPGETLHVSWPCSASAAAKDGLSWEEPQTGVLEFDVPCVQPQTVEMQTNVELEGWLTITGVRASYTPLGTALEIDYRSGTRLKAAIPEWRVEDGARSVERNGTLLRTGSTQMGYTVRMQTDALDSLPHTLTLGVYGLSSRIQFDFDRQTATVIEEAER